MRVKTLAAVCSLALAFLLVLPGVALGQQRAVGELVSEINGALASNPSANGTYQLTIDSTGKLVAEQTDASGVLARWEMYFEDIVTVDHTGSGHVYIVCAEGVGRCVRQTCNGVYANFEGCVRGEGQAARTQYSEALELGYAYDTRAMRSLMSAFDELLTHDLGM